MAIAAQEDSKKTKLQPLPRVRLELVDVFGRMAQALSFPRSVGEIYGLLYLAPEPMSAPEISEALSISKGSVSTGTRQLLTLGFIRKVWLQEERKDYFEAVLELGNMVRTAYDQIFKVRAQNAERRLTDVTDTLADERAELSPEEYALIKERLERLTKLQKRAKQFMPLLERLIK
jgi:HTH-type transcriptional regulator, glycine betaine synthesis regulator